MIDTVSCVLRNKVDQTLVAAIESHGNLLMWMRETLREGFAQSVEIISGLSEAQCPDDLWEDRNKKLGALSEVSAEYFCLKLLGVGASPAYN